MANNTNDTKQCTSPQEMKNMCDMCCTFSDVANNPNVVTKKSPMYPMHN